MLLHLTEMKARRPLVVIALTGALAAGLSGCAGTAADSGSTVGSTTPTTSSASALCDPAGHAYGDSIAVAEVTDGLGEYCRTAVSPTATAMLKDTSVYDAASLAQYGITEDQAFAAQKRAVVFLASEGIDSSALDTNTDGVVGNDAAAATWFAKNVGLFDPRWSFQYTDSGNIYSSNVIVNGYTPALIRDGSPRFTASSFTVDRVSSHPTTTNITNQVVVQISAKVTYRATDRVTLDFLLKEHPDATVDSLTTQYPALADGTGENNILLAGQFVYSYAVDSDLITGNSFHYDINYNTEPGF